MPSGVWGRESEALRAFPVPGFQLPDGAFGSRIWSPETGNSVFSDRRYEMTLWGGRFEDQPADILWEYTVDTVDRRLLADDIAGSMAHVSMLLETEILPAAEARQLLQGLGQIQQEALGGTFTFTETDEDVHTAVERRLVEIIGPLGGKLHTGRSRNDQIALDLRLYLSRMGRARIGQLARFTTTLLDVAERWGDVIVPSYTHLQQAQAVPLAHHLLAYAEMLRRDAHRFQSALTRIEVSPLGAGASGGSSLPLDPSVSARQLGWSWHFINSMDAVASRDFVAEYVFCATQSMVHLSRLAEELILWASTEFGWVTFSDQYTTGSSALPHKKNPDIAELVRGRAAVVIGDLTAIVTLQKGLPLAYNRDLQEDKAIVFRADDTLARSLAALGPLLETARFHPPAPSSWVTALDLAEALVLRGVPFREAHASVGRLVAQLTAQGRPLSDASRWDLKSADDRFTDDDLTRIDPSESVAARRAAGAASFESVQRQIAWLRQAIAQAMPPS